MPAQARGGAQALDLRCNGIAEEPVVDSSKPRFSWRFDSKERGAAQTAYRLQCAKEEDFKGLLWDSGWVEEDRTFDVEYGGPALESRADVFWRVAVRDESGAESSWSETAKLSVGLLKRSDWKAEWIGLDGESGWLMGGMALIPPVYLRSEFTISKKLKRAVLRASALGLYEARLNGRKVGDLYLTPGDFTEETHVYYNTFDVTKELRPGANVLGGVVGGGWRNWNMSGKTRTSLRLLAQLELLYEDGSVETLATSPETWKAKTGPERYCHILNGESFDARDFFFGWDSANFDDSSWKKPVSGCVDDKAACESPLEPYPCQPLRVRAIRKPVDVKDLLMYRRIIDMGRYFSGFVRLKLRKMKRGQCVRVWLGDWLDVDGTVYVANRREAGLLPSEYICRGDELEIFEPKFFFSGFRYLQVEGVCWSEQEAVEAVDGVELAHLPEDASSFVCGSGTVNAIQAATVRTCRADFIEKPMDCPQRNERQGWAGDASAFSKEAMLEGDYRAFFRKWLDELVRAQLPDGNLPAFVPRPQKSGSTPGWADAIVIVPWNHYLIYGEKSLLEKCLPSVRRYVEYAKSRLGEDGLATGKDAFFGDWLCVGGAGNEEWGGGTSLTCDCITILMFNTAKKIALALGDSEFASRCASCAELTSKGVREKHCADGMLKRPSQGNCAALLMSGALDGHDEMKAKVGKQLVEEFRKKGWRQGTGIMTTRFVPYALEEAGFVSDAVSVLLCAEYPSLGYIANAAPGTIWEHWDGCKDGKPYQLSPVLWRTAALDQIPCESMNSACHFGLGAGTSWLLEGVCGIRPLEPGYRKIRVKPCVDERLGYAEGTLNSASGKIRSSWRFNEGAFRMEVEIPPNAKAEIHVPCFEGREIRATPEMKPFEVKSGFAVFHASAGLHAFEA